MIWYLLGFIMAFGMMLLGNKFLYQNAYIFYIVGVILLLLVLFFGIDVNNARCWFKIPFIGSLQPSEFMKVFLIITLARMIDDFNMEHSNPEMIDEFKFLLKVMIIVFIPSILTFIEPDTGAVIIYLIITLIMLFIGGLRSKWFIITIGIFLILGIIFIALYLTKQELFIEIFGTSFFYRMDRIFNWTTNSGLQLTNSIEAISSGGILGHGFNNIPIYFPEMQTDFIFAVYASCFGLLGSLFLIGLIIFFDINLIITVNKTTNNADKYAIGGIISYILYSQVHNISMTLGLLPIMGITLPFISYGGSSLMALMLLVGLIFNVSNESLRFTN